jgi:sulfur-oxidizing protein SoxY
MQRRDFLQAFGSATALAPLVGAGLLSPTRALAVSFNRAAFEARTAADALRLIGAAGAETSRDIQLKAPEVAENGAAVPIEVASSIPGTTRLSVLVDKNPCPWPCSSISQEKPGPLPGQAAHGESSRLRVVATAGGKHYTVFREVKVTVGGCGD